VIGPRGSGGSGRLGAGSGARLTAVEAEAEASASNGLAGSRPAEAPTIIIPHTPTPARSRLPIPRQTIGISQYGAARSGEAVEVAVAIIAVEVREPSRAGEEGKARAEGPTS
jgi:hypothetical protein